MTPPEADRHQDEPNTLGELLFSRNPARWVPESAWTALVQAIARRDQRALHALYLRMHRIVFTFLVKLTKNRDTAEHLTLNVFHEVWRRPSVFDPARSSVVGWIMNLARSRAIDRLWSEQRTKGAADPSPVPNEPGEEATHDVLSTAAPSWEQLAPRISAERGTGVAPDLAPERAPDWDDAAPGLSYVVLARDVEKERVGMLVRLASRAAYPGHIHAGVEELYLLDGELFIDGRRLYPGDYNRAEIGTGDQQVWSETGCTCVLLTSTKDILRPIG